MGPYSHTPRVSHTYHRLFSSRYPPPKCTGYTGLELFHSPPATRKSHSKPPPSPPLTIAQCQRDVKDVTLFFRRGSPLSNFYPCRLTDPTDGLNYSCSEQYYQAAKADCFQDHEAYKYIMKSNNPAHMKVRAERIKNVDKAEWARIKRGILRRAVLLKFSQNPRLRRALYRTRGTIVEASPGDSYWGVGRSLWDPRASEPKSWRGENVMGQILMEVREQLRNDGRGDDEDDGEIAGDGEIVVQVSS